LILLHNALNRFMIHADVKTKAVKDLGIVKMAGSGKGIKGIVKPVSNMNEFFDMEFGKNK
ncbi:hypothetical protein, partial [Bacillus velezensis]|uniref:hypothetical protein n=1 Tax=Bacillus velezensis TaxID=492670 RepID=UPI001BB0D598